MPTLAEHTDAAVMLNEARVLIERKGWARGVARAADGAVCLSQALSDVDGKKHSAAVDQEARRLIVNLIGGGSIPEWNDRFDRTTDEVITLLQACAQIEQELGTP